MKKSAFTMPELLIVVGIFALAITMLLPAANYSRGKATAAACAGNLKKTHAIAMQYTADNRNFWPSVNDQSRTALQNSYVWALARGKYIKAPSVPAVLAKTDLKDMRCPEIPFNQKRANTAFAQVYGTPVNNQWGYGKGDLPGFYLNDHTFGEYIWDYDGNRIPDARYRCRPRHIIMFADSYAWAAKAARSFLWENKSNNGNLAQVADLHACKSNMISVAGHYEAVSPHLMKNWFLMRTRFNRIHGLIQISYYYSTSAQKLARVPYMD